MNMKKNLKISPELHKQIKIICAIEGVKINEWLEKQLWKKINDLNDKMDERKMS